ncbi:hypothetical protein MFUL124B02_27190 [Myxococcus fulvus 124B02]|nr:hypothetical protein MFUL124B02_27190 [Myxococcus fulvus 124B02]
MSQFTADQHGQLREGCVRVCIHYTRHPRQLLVRHPLGHPATTGPRLKPTRLSIQSQQPIHRGAADLELLGQFFVRLAGRLPHLDDAAT